MLPLQGVGVLVTRPEHQAMPLCRLLAAQGAIPHRLPAVDIKPVAGSGEFTARLGPIEAFDLIIFTSANAVKFGAALLDGRRGLTLAAIGPATARALDHAGYPVAVCPNQGFDSETLLRLPQLEQSGGRRVLIIKGLQGRDLLQQQLIARGAQVMVAAVYRRERARYSAQELAALQVHFDAGAIQVITATSADLAAGLLELATPALRCEFDRVHWLVPGARVARAVRELGVAAPLIEANSAEDHDLVSAIRLWRAPLSGA